ncbi:unnamed protein product [Brassicogethes aeneus]|uniref:Alpha-N-acetylglucosaminidase n=1 Tax=Brassicogethes aeneus TaxID=1431903 RepID=A0A9P0BDF2_BRAAE|nr:unnamed protein product [Brassicogethes aeneus]
MLNRQLCLLLFTSFLGVALCDNFQSTLGHIKPKVSVYDQENAVKQLIKRIIPDRYQDFIVEVNNEIGNGNDAFNIQKVNDKIKITASTGVAVATGFNYYLKYFCNSQVAWQVTRIEIPEILPQVNLTITLNDRFRYYQNVCTTGYSFVWWSWEQWEKHIDWMALNAFNLVLAFNGQEAIWDRVYSKLNLTQEDIDEHFSGPAFLPWLRMGNMRGWGGPLSNAWHVRSLMLQKQILGRMRSLGIIPVLSAFAGHLPRAFKSLYPDTNMTKMEVWNDFNDTYCCPYFLDPTEDLFNKIGTIFLIEQINEFGTDHVYNCDSFNEVDPSTKDLTYLQNVGKSIYKAMTDVDPKSIWLMQGWLFVHSFFYWTNERAKALLTSIPLGKMIVLDLQSEQFPQYDRLHQYYGQPYIWCMLHNFGGTLGIFGSTDIINERPIQARNAPNSTMIGIGLTPEGINQNYVVYDFMIENAWRDKPRDKKEWVEGYIRRRYGQSNKTLVKSWSILMETIYNYKLLFKIRGHYAISITPKLNFETWAWYKSTDLHEAWKGFIESADDFKDSQGFLHDLVDITRQSLQVYGDYYYEKLKKDFKNKDLHSFNESSSKFLELFPDLQDILASNKDFLLGNWIRDAKVCANNSHNLQDEKLYEYNARNQITLWGPGGEILDYANKQWAGVIDEYFERRWVMFIEYAMKVLRDNDHLNKDYIKTKIFKEVEEAFTFDTREVPTKPKGNTIEIAKQIHEKWSDLKNVEVYSKRSGKSLEENFVGTQSFYEPSVILKK